MATAVAAQWIGLKRRPILAQIRGAVITEDVVIILTNIGINFPSHVSVAKADILAVTVVIAGVVDVIPVGIGTGKADYSSVGSDTRLRATASKRFVLTVDRNIRAGARGPPCTGLAISLPWISN